MSNIIIPYPNSKNFKFYIENQIDGFYIGIDGFSENFNNLVPVKGLKNAVKYVKSLNKICYIMLNKVYFNEKMDELKSLLYEISKLNIDAVFFSDMSVFNIVKDNNYNIKLIWSGKMVTSSKSINFLAKRGLYGFLCTPQITFDEFLKIESNTNINSFIKLFGYTNMATSSRKLISNYFKYTNIKKPSEGKYLMYDRETKKYYPIIERENTNFFSNKILNGILEYKELLNKNIDTTIILDDFLITENSFYNVMEAFIALRNYPTDSEFADKLKQVVESNTFNNTDNGFLHKKTIFKVKNNE